MLHEERQDLRRRASYRSFNLVATLGIVSQFVETAMNLIAIVPLSSYRGRRKCCRNYKRKRWQRRTLAATFIEPCRDISYNLDNV